MGKTKRILSVFLAVLMAFSSLTVGLTAFAADEIKVYDGLDDNYQALASALQSKYVTQEAEYTKGTNSYSANDNELGEVKAAAEAFYNCMSATFDTNAGGTEKKLYNEAQTVSDKLKNAMGRDYTSRMEDIVRKYFTGLGDTQDIGNGTKCTFSVMSGVENALMEFDSISDFPNEVVNRVDYEYTQENVWVYYLVRFNKNEQKTNTNDIKTKINNFNTLYSVIGTDYENLTDDTKNKLQRDGQNIINNVSSYSEAFVEKFCVATVEDAQRYLNGYFKFTTKEYSELIKAIGEKCEKSEISDFNYEQLAELKAQLDSANRLYNSFNGTQKNEVKSELNKYNEYNQFYLNSYNYNVGVEYAAVLDKAAPYFADGYVIAKDELETVKGILDEAQNVYKKYSGKITDSSVTDTQKTLKARYDEYLRKYQITVEKYEWEDYTLNIQKLAEMFKTHPSLLEINSSSVIDDKDGTILKTAELFVSCAQFVNKQDKETYKDMALITDKIIESLRDGDAMGDAVNDNAVRVLKLMGGVSEGVKQGVTAFTVAPAYLEQYNSVSEIPEIITYEIIFFTYDHESNWNGSVKSLKTISRTSDPKTDSNAYATFALFTSVFTEDVLTKDLNTCTDEELNRISKDGKDAVEVVKAFDEKTVNRLLGEDFAKAQAIVVKSDELLVSRFNAYVNQLNETYGGHKLREDDVDGFTALGTKIEQIYNWFTDEQKADETVNANWALYQSLKAECKEVIDKTHSERFADMVKELEKKYPKKDMDYSQYNPFSEDVIEVNNYYDSLSPEAKELSKSVKAYEDLQELIAAMEEVRAAHFLDKFYADAEKYLLEWYTGELSSPAIREFTAAQISDVRNVTNLLEKSYSNLSSDGKNEEKVTQYMAIVSLLKDRIKQLIAEPEFSEYNVEYPDGVTPDQVQDIINRINALLESGMIDELLGGQSLQNFVNKMLNENLFTPDMINMLMQLLFPLIIDAVGDLTSLIELIGMHLFPNSVSSNTGMADYPETQKALSAAGGDWTKVDWSKCNWVRKDGTRVHNVDTFCDALGSALNGLNIFLKILLCGDSIEIAKIYGNEGYRLDILPFLEVLGCNETHGLKDNKGFNDEKDDVRKMLKNILKPLMNRVNEILEDNTLNEILDILPDLAYVFQYDMIRLGVVDLCKPLASFGMDVNQILIDNNIDLSDIVGLISSLALKDSDIVIPQINWVELSGIGTWNKDYPSLRGTQDWDNKRNHIEARKPDVLVYLLYYAVEFLNANDSMLQSAIDGAIDNETLKTIINTVLSTDDKTFVKSLVTILTAYDAPDYTWADFDFTKTNVAYPNTFNAQDMDMLVNSLSDILTKVIGLLLDGSLNDVINNNLYTGAIASVLFNALYSALDNETLAMLLSHIEVKDADGNIVKIDLTKDAVYKNLKSAGFKDAAKAVKDADSLKAAITTPEDWKIENAEDFVNAVCAILAPFNSVLTALLAGKGYEVTALNVVELYGANGYNNAVKPLLDALGCDSMSVAEYNEAAHKDSANALKNILMPLLNLVSTIADDPLKSVIDIIPQASLIIDNGGIQTAVRQLLAPLNNVLGGVSMLLKTDDIYEWLISDLVSSLAGVDLDWNNLQNQIIPLLNDKVLKNIEINENTSLSLVLPELDWSHFAGCMNKTTNGYETVTADSAVEIIRYIWSAVQGNKTELDKLIKSLVDADTYKTLSPILNKLFSLHADELIKIFIDLLNGLDSSSFKADWSFLYKDVAKTNVKYPNGVKAKDVQNLVNTLSDLLNNVIAKFLDGSLTDLVGNNLYTDDIITKLATTIFSLADNSTVNTVLGILGVNLSKDAIVKMLRKDYPSVSKSIDKADNILSVDTSKWKWNVTDKASFAKALVAVLRPFEPVLDVLLNSGAMNIAGVIDFRGANGYENAVKPLLDAFGCSTVSPNQYAGDAKKNADNLLLNIINPLLDKVDVILKNPVTNLAEMLPQLANFVDKGGVQYAVECLLYPVTNLANPLLSVLLGQDDIFELVSLLLGVKWDNLHNEIIPILNDKLLKDLDINGTKLSLKLPNIAWGKLAGCGTVKGNSIKADVPAVTVTLIDYLWSAVQANKSTLNTLIKSLAGDDTYKSLSPYINKLLAIDSQKVVEILVNVIKGLDSSSYKADWSFLYKNYNETAVNLPDGVSSSDLQQVVEILSEALNNALGIFLDKPLTSLVGETLYKDSIITSLAKTIYSLGDNETVVTVFGLLGCDFSKDAIVQSLGSDYKAVSKSIDKAKTLSSADTSKWQWNVTDRASFAKALVAVLRPLAPVLEVLLNSGSINIADVIDFRGANGYENAVKPLLDALGCSTVSQSKYTRDAKNNADNVLLNIINPLLDQVDAILANPVEMVAELAPQLANFIDKGGVQYAVENLLYPVINLINPILSVITNETIFDFLFDILDVNISWSNLQYQLVPLLNDAVLSDLKINGKKLSLLLPSIDWGTLAGCGVVKSNSIKADTGKELITLLRYVFSVLNKNENTLTSLVGGKDSTAGKIIANVLGCGADKLTQIVVNILLKMDTFDNVSWVFKAIAQQTTKYTANLGKEEYAQALEQIDPLISGLISELAGKSLTELATGALYTNNIVNTLAKLIYTNLESLDIGIDLNMVLSLVDVDISTSGVANAVSDYKSASNQIAKCSKWADVNFDNLNWGFKDGDREGFVNALAAVLRPLHSVLRAVLSGEDLVVLGSIEIKGGNGYNTAIIPIAEALGIDSKALISPSQYAKDAGSDKVLTDILNPLLDKVEDILKSPVKSLADMLPNLAYFVYNGGVKAAVDNLIAPVTRILDEIDPIYSVNLDLSMLDNLDIDSLVNSLIKDIKIKGKPLGIQITNINLEILAGRGTLETYRSARTYNGSQMQAKRIDADSTAVFISVLRYLVENIKFNLDAINNLLAGLDIPDNIAGIINQVLTALTTEDVDSVIEMLMDLLFGFGGGEALQVTPDEERFDPFNLGNYYWVYWVIFAAVTAATGFFLFLILKKKKEREEDLSVNEIKGENV